MRVAYRTGDLDSAPKSARLGEEDLQLAPGTEEQERPGA
jgi:hypothetical protein